MKILLNACPGGFALDEVMAKDFCDRLGLETVIFSNPVRVGLKSSGRWLRFAFENNRMSPALIALVKEYIDAGKRVSYDNADIQIVETDDSRLWYIAEEYGKETIVYLDENKETK